MDISSLNLALPPDGTAPDWVHLVPSGTFKGKDGRGPYTLPKNPIPVIDRSLQHGAIPFDENHATEAASIIGGAAPARGWIDKMEARADGIWGHVAWTDDGKALMTGKAYRWLSPVLLLDKADKQTIVAISSVGLTNNPNLIFDLKAMQAALTGAERNKIKPEHFAVPGKQALPIEDAEHVKLAWSMVGRTEGLTDSERMEARRRIRARATELGVDTSGWAAQTAEGQMEKKAICTVLGIPETTEDGAVLVALQTAHAELQSVRTENTQLKGEVQTMKTTHVPVETFTALQTRVDTMEADGKKAAATAFVDGAIKAGKPIGKEVRANYIAMHTANPAEIELLINAMPSLNAAGPAGTFKAKQDGDDDTVEGMSAEDRKVCQTMNLDPVKFIENRKKMMAEQKGRS